MILGMEAALFDSWRLSADKGIGQGQTYFLFELTSCLCLVALEILQLLAKSSRPSSEGMENIIRSPTQYLSSLDICFFNLTCQMCFCTYFCLVNVMICGKSYVFI